MTKFYVASFSRASDGILNKLISKMKDENLYTPYYPQADYIIACGDRQEVFDFTLAAYRENKKIIHLWAGEMSQGTHDEVYRHAITMMSCMQLCSTVFSFERTKHLLEVVGIESNAHLVGNLCYDDLEVDESIVPQIPYDLVLYNPPTLLDHFQILEELGTIRGILDIHTIWIEPNGDKGSEYLEEYITHKSLPRPQFLGLIKNCSRFITNSSCQYVEAPFLMDKDKIIPIGIRNSNREDKYATLDTPGASDKIIEILKTL